MFEPNQESLENDRGVLENKRYLSDKHKQKRYERLTFD